MKSFSNRDSQDPKYGTRFIENRFRFGVALTTSVVTSITLVIAFLTPPLSGPFCEGGCFEYPYTGIISRFPRDYFWMYPAIIVSLLYLVLMVCIHYYASAERKIFSHIGLSISLIASTILIIDYFVQVSVIQPSLVKGETDGVAILSQYNPHGLFIALEEIGYLLMSLSFICVAPVFSSANRLHKALRVTLAAGFPMATAGLILITVKYGIMREYIFEVMIISIVWLELIIASLLLARIFRREFRIAEKKRGAFQQLQ